MRRPAAFILILLAACLFTGCSFINGIAGNTSEPPDLSGLIEVKKSEIYDYNSSKWPADSRLICGSAPYPAADLLDCKILKANETCTLQFQNMNIQAFINYLSGLRDARWYLSEAGAFKGMRKVNIAYKDNILKLDFSKSGGDGDWPEELPAELCEAVPYFHYGAFDQLFEKQGKGIKQIYVCVFKQVSEDDALKYENTLLENGFIYRTNTNQRRYFEKGRFFVAPNLKYGGNFYSIIIGERRSDPPYWPDSLPLDVRNSLPVPCCTGTVSQNGETTRIDFADMHLDDAVSWFGELIKGGYEFSDGETLQNKSKGVFLRIADYTPAANRLSVEMSTIQTGPYLIAGFDDGRKDYDFALTKGKYGAKDLRKGVAKEFGKDAALADWKDIAGYGKNAPAFLDACGAAKNESIWLSFNKSEFKGKKHYMLMRVNGRMKGAPLQKLGGNSVWLVLSDSSKQRVLVKVKKH